MVITTTDIRPRHAGLRRLRRRSIAIAAAAATTVAFPTVHAAEWRFTPTVSATETYTDNVSLATRGMEHSDFVTQVAPGFTITSNSPRLKLSVIYSLEGTTYLHGSGGTSLANQLSATMNAELIRNLFFLDARGGIGQQNISAFGPQSANNININNNRTDVLSYSISPYLRHSFGSKAFSEVRYTHESVNSGSDLLSPSNTDRVNFSLTSGESSSKITLGLRGSAQRAKASNQPSVEQDNLNADLRYFLTPNFSTTAAVGYEKETYVSIGDQPTNGVYYNAGFIWKPTSRTNVTAMVGHRFFGRTYSLQADHRARNAVFRVSYAEDITTAQQQFSAQSTISTFSFLDQLYSAQIPDPATRAQVVNALILQTGLPASLANPINSLTNTYFLQKSLQGSLALNGVRNTIVLSVFDTRRTAESVRSGSSGPVNSPLSSLNDSNKQIGGAAVWNMRLSSSISALADVNATRTTSLTTARVDNYKSLRLSLSRQFQNKLTGSLALRHSQQSSDVLGGDIRENAITASVFAKF